MNAIIVYTADEFQKVYRQLGNERGTWIVWVDKMGGLDS